MMPFGPSGLTYRDLSPTGDKLAGDGRGVPARPSAAGRGRGGVA